MTIRKYQAKDYDYVIAVFLGCKEPPEEIDEGRMPALLTFCLYYIEQEPNNCFVAVDDEDKPVGYVICAQNYKVYKRRYNKIYVPRLRKYGLKRSFMGRATTFTHKLFSKQYPAHLHMDVLGDYQRMGLGTALVDALCEHLKAQGVKGLMLTTSSNNEKGVNFYKKYGFTLIEKYPFETVYVMRLTL